MPVRGYDAARARADARRCLGLLALPAMRSPAALTSRGALSVAQRPLRLHLSRGVGGDNSGAGLELMSYNGRDYDAAAPCWRHATRAALPMGRGRERRGDQELGTEDLRVLVR